MRAETSGYITSIDSLELGLTGITLGAGRTKVDDLIDPKAGIMLKKKVGDQVQRGELLAEISTDNETIIDEAAQRVLHAFEIGDVKPKISSLVISQVDKFGVKNFVL